MRTGVQTAVVPAAGFGTRMRPATRAVPKELLPVGGRPAIEWVVDEAARAGLRHLVVVSSLAKPAIDAYFGQDLRPWGSDAGDWGSWARRAGACTVEVVHQPAPRGLGDAVRVARASVDPEEPLAVLLPDELLLGGPRLLERMADHHARTGRSVVSLLRIEPEEASAYGCARVLAPPGATAPALVVGCVEKPPAGSGMSPYALSGRYVLGADVLDALEAVEPDGRGELQLTAALDVAARRNGLVGVELPPGSGRVDVGSWRGWLEANVRLLADGVPRPEPAGAALSEPAGAILAATGGLASGGQGGGT